MNRLKNARSLRHELVLFRNDNYLAINKPLGIETSSGKEMPKSLRAKLDQVGLIGIEVAPVPINSMKESVSGVQLLSRHPAAGKLGRSMMREGPFWRSKYWGIGSGRIAGNSRSGVVNVPIKDGCIASDGIPSITHWRVLKYCDIHKLTLIEYEPRTNVEGQILIHSENVLKTPVVSDLGLHLVSLTVSLPNTIDIFAPVRDEFKIKMQSLGWF